MPITYAWNIDAIECVVENSGKQNIVETIFWTRLADDGDSRTTELRGAQTIVLDKTAPFIPFDQLTKEQVISWVEDSLGVVSLERIDAELNARIQAQIAPTTIIPPLPWAAE